MIDGGYLGVLNKKNFCDSKGKPHYVDYGKVGQILVGRHNCELLRSYFYSCAPYISPKPTEEEKQRQRKFDQFLFNLKKLDRLAVRLGKLKKFQGPNGEFEFEQKGVDVQLAIDALQLSLKGKIQKVILIAGDSDFVPVIEAIKDEGIDVILYYHESSVHRMLLEVCDLKIQINQDIMNSFC